MLSCICPCCGSEMHPVAIATNPPIPAVKCFNCGYYEDEFVPKTVEEIKQEVLDCTQTEEGRSEWVEYTGADAGFHYCKKCCQQAFNYEDSGQIIEVLSDFCPSCGRAMNERSWNILKSRFNSSKEVNDGNV